MPPRPKGRSEIDMKIQLTIDGSEDGGRRPGARESDGLWKLRMVLRLQPATKHRPQSYNGKELYSANNRDEPEMDSPLQAPERNETANTLIVTW